MEWRACIGFPQYEVSECGDVRRAVRAATRQAGWRHRGYIDQDGYLQYTLENAAGEKQRVSAHNLVAAAFLGPQPSPEHEVAHNNGSRIHNHFSNLRWATRAENHADIQVHGSAVKGERNGRAKVTEDDVRSIRTEYREIKASRGRRRVGELDRKYGLDRSTIINIAKGKTWQHVDSLN